MEQSVCPLSPAIFNLFFGSQDTHKLITKTLQRTEKCIFGPPDKKLGMFLIHSPRTTVVVLAVVIFLFDGVRKERSVPLMTWSGTACFNNSHGSAVENHCLSPSASLSGCELHAGGFASSSSVVKELSLFLVLPPMTTSRGAPSLLSWSQLILIILSPPKSPPNEKETLKNVGGQYGCLTEAVYFM